MMNQSGVTDGNLSQQTLIYIFCNPGVVGLTKAHFPLSNFSLFLNDHNIGYLLNITFIFDRCHSSWAAVTPVKYECGWKDERGASVKSEILLMEAVNNKQTFGVWYPPQSILLMRGRLVSPTYQTSHITCTHWCTAWICLPYIIVFTELLWFIYPYSSELLHNNAAMRYVFVTTSFKHVICINFTHSWMCECITWYVSTLYFMHTTIPRTDTFTLSTSRCHKPPNTCQLIWHWSNTFVCYQYLTWIPSLCFPGDQWKIIQSSDASNANTFGPTVVHMVTNG